MKAALPERLMWTAYLAWHWHGQSRFPFRSGATIEATCSRRIRRMIAHAYGTVPYYKETMQRLDLLPGDFRNAADLGRLPVIEREDLQKDPEYFRSTAMPAAKNLETRSGGSTGAPRVVWWDTAAVFQNAAHAERERSIIAGIVGDFVHYRETVIGSAMSSDAGIQAIYRDRALLPSRARMRYQHLSLTDSPEKNLTRLNQFRPDVIRTFGSYLARLFSYLHSSGASFHRPKVVFYDADELPESARRLIADEFGIPVLSAYQAVEAFKIGFECERHLGFHLNTDISPLRIVNGDGAEVAAGESGDVLVSNLVNRATVLLNYRLGDVARLFPEMCPCGRTLPLLSFIEGRTDDWIALSRGEVVHPQSVRNIFTEEQTVVQYQVIQKEIDSFSVSIAGGQDRESLESRVRGRFARQFGPDVRVEVAFVDAIEPAMNGKVRPVISLVSQGAR